MDKQTSRRFREGNTAMIVDTEGLQHAAVDGARILRTAIMPHDTPSPLTALRDALGDTPLELVFLFVSPQADIHALAGSVSGVFGTTPVIGCTTAGSLSQLGYSDGMILAIGLPRDSFRTSTLLIEDLSDVNGQKLIETMIRSRHDLQRDQPDWQHEFNFVMIDGLSTLEDALTAEMAAGLGPVPLFGGSAGDEDRFGETFVLYGDRVFSNAAVLTQLRSRCRVKVFNTDHFTPTEQRVVVTRASPDLRVVHEINAEPAAEEYARLLNTSADQLDTFTFAAHPLVVRLGDQHHVRSIQRVDPNGDLVFFSAIDEGLVLTLAEPQDMIDHLKDVLEDLGADGPPDAILACECLFRRMEAEQTQVTGAVRNLFQKHRVMGLSTYGEQVNSMHVNQTLTGVAIYPPDG